MKSQAKIPEDNPDTKVKRLSSRNKVDKTLKHTPSFCNCYGKDLSLSPELLCGKRQVVDIPPPQVERTEHQVFSKTCSCGYTTQSEFPAYVKSQLCRYPHVEAIIAYMHTRQYLPFNRMKEFFSDVMGLPVSEGGISHILERFTQKALPVYAQIKERIKAADFLGTDETGAKVNGKKHWFWTWQNKQLTFVVHSDNRV